MSIYGKSDGKIKEVKQIWGKSDGKIKEVSNIWGKNNNGIIRLAFSKPSTTIERQRKYLIGDWVNNQDTYKFKGSGTKEITNKTLDTGIQIADYWFALYPGDKVIITIEADFTNSYNNFDDTVYFYFNLHYKIGSSSYNIFNYAQNLSPNDGSVDNSIEIYKTINIDLNSTYNNHGVPLYGEYTINAPSANGSILRIVQFDVDVEATDGKFYVIR